MLVYMITGKRSHDKLPFSSTNEIYSFKLHVTRLYLVLFQYVF